ncbi:hypothetical protein BD310DRAFT_957311 [Dichomitus squalens]|uniref:RanBP2-type domain-containing protein n=1 Tax=Dichomitus squalens TaxID=114155 RepID=A0A4Q9Q1X8_9APHY|nr:hypothetical protein BD310DRAFT_957311 [Dichomitus squalens]
MSGGAVRTSSTRRHTRNNNASPYARPSAKKSSGWSLTGLLNYLNPFNSSHSEQERSSPPPEGEVASRLAARGQEIQTEGTTRRDSGYSNSFTQQRPAQPQPQPQPQPPAQPTSQSPPAVSMNGSQRISPRSDHSSSSSIENIKKIRQFLDEKEGQGQSLNAIEVAGLVHLLQNSVEDYDEQEPFRFSRSPSATPMRGMTPTNNMFSPNAMEHPAGNGAQSVPKTLAKNPMGVYHWRGGGSARPRNRYQSPNFGSKPVRTTIKLQPEKSRADTKRRRVGEEATTSSPQRAGATAVPKANGTTTPSVSASASATSALNGSASVNGMANGRANGAPPPTTPSRPGIRTSGVKPTAPAIPSPLRQTWGQTDSPPQPQGKPTRAASFMTELIKEVTPPKKPDFVNPYEAANPIIKPPPKKQPIRKMRVAAAKTEEPKKVPELTPQAIIEATVPKGSKRSRPPPELIGVKSPEKRVTSPESAAPRRSTRLNGAESSAQVNGAPKAPVVEEVSEEEQPSPPKKQRTLTLPPAQQSKVSTFIVEEVDDVEMSLPSRSAQPSYTLPSEIIEPGDDKVDKKRATSPTSAFPGFGAAARGAKSSAPKAPSKLRFSIQVEREEKADAVAAPASTPVPAPFSAPAPTFAASQPAKAPVAPEKPKDVRVYVAAMRQDELPTYTFTPPLSSPGAGPSTLRARQIAKAAPVSSLPTYDFTKVPAPAPAAKPTGGFDWSAAGIKPPPKAAGESWTCSVCMLQNSTAGDKCTVCDAPRPDKPKPATAQGGFNWAAAGIKPPPKPAGGQWTCSVCMLSNPSDAAKCTVCDSPR